MGLFGDRALLERKSGRLAFRQSANSTSRTVNVLALLGLAHHAGGIRPPEYEARLAEYEAALQEQR